MTTRVRAWAKVALAALACAFAAAPGPAFGATLHSRLDFEMPGYGSSRRVITDHYLMNETGTWHLFYTELPGPYAAASRIGHATSPDLVHWTELPAAITAGGTAWTATGAWAPHVVAHPGGGWRMLFTGRAASGAQAIGALASADLVTWTLASPDPVFTPSTTWAAWDAGTTSNCRDPFVWFEGGAYSMIYTAKTKTGRPALGHARSTDLLTWTDAGPFAVDSTSTSPTDLESPFLVFDNGRVELLYSRFYLRFLSAATSAGPWDVAAGAVLDAQSVAPEWIKSGATQLMSRVRQDSCDPLTSLVVIDTVTATPGGYAIPGPPGPPAGARIEGDAFALGTIWGDGPKRRGQTPAAPQGRRWLASGETDREPGDVVEPCVTAEQAGRLGSIRLPRFPLLGDSLWFRVMGAASIDSAYVRLLDACTGLELARRTGPGTTALVPAAWSNAGRKGWPVELEVADWLDRPGGVIGLDAVRDSTVGTYTALAGLAINQTMPQGGENLPPGGNYTVRWSSFSTAGMDSHVVYVSYDNFATPPIRLMKRNGNQFSWNWTVPTGVHHDVRIRVVAYAKNGVHDCDTSPPFTIAATIDAPPPPPRALSLAARGTPGPTPALEWSAAPGTRADLGLYDVRGRRVRRLVVDGPGDGEPRLAPWDGRDEAGRLAPPGLYFAVLAGSDGARRHVTVVRLAR